MPAGEDGDAEAVIVARVDLWSKGGRRRKV
jgi:hypothetical protein